MGGIGVVAEGGGRAPPMLFENKAPAVSSAFSKGPRACWGRGAAGIETFLHNLAWTHSGEECLLLGLVHRRPSGHLLSAALCWALGRPGVHGRFYWILREA